MISVAKKYLLISAVALLVCVFSIHVVLSQTGTDGTGFILPSDGDGSIVLGGSEGNAYVLGDIVTVNSPMVGDIYTIADSMHIHGSVFGDIGFVGNGLHVIDSIDGDIRGISNQAVIHQEVTGEVVYIGTALTINTDSVVEGNLTAIADRTTIKGTIVGDVYVEGTSLDIYGSVQGEIHATEVTKISLHPGSVIKGDIPHSNIDKHSLFVDPNATILGGLVIADGVEDEMDDSSFLFDIITLLIFLSISGLLAHVALYSRWNNVLATSFTRGIVSICIGFASIIFLTVASLVILFIPGLVAVAFAVLCLVPLLIFFGVFSAPVIVGALAYRLCRLGTSVTALTTALGVIILLPVFLFSSILAFCILLLVVCFVTGVATRKVVAYVQRGSGS